jgi:oligopeptide transport system ATP-binding protein
MSEIILDVKNLKVQFATYGGVVQAVRGVSFQVKRAKTLAIVGESGCGKSVSVQSLMGLIPTPPGKITDGEAFFNGRELLNLSTSELNKIRGNEIGFIFQDPMSSLNPTMTIGNQIAETLRIHKRMGAADARKRAIELLEKVHIPEASTRVDNYPFQFSGGMRQRAMIAMAIACDPKILIADEPTTALDVTIQAQILNLLKELQIKNQMALVLITHDLGVVAKMADEVAVMYAGQIVEFGNASDIFYHPSHPYTIGLQNALPSDDRTRERLEPIEGSPPDLFKPPEGCGYFARCPHAMKVCETHIPPNFNDNQKHTSRCWLHHPAASHITDTKTTPSPQNKKSAREVSVEMTEVEL